MSKRPKLEELNVLDDFLLNAIANDPDVGEAFFREVLSILLEREIGEIQVKAQSVIPGDSPELRGIRLDVEIYETDDSRPNVVFTTWSPRATGRKAYKREAATTRRRRIAKA